MDKIKQQLKRRKRVRSKVRGTKDRPRLSVFRSSKFIYAQVINDETKTTLIGISEKVLDRKIKSQKIERAKSLGLLLGKKALEKNIRKVVFDKGSYAYHGRVKALAEGAREGGLVF